MSLTPGAAISSYGVLLQASSGNQMERVAEQLRHLGYAVLDPGFSSREIESLSSRFDQAHAAYIARHGEQRLRAIDEYNGIRLPLAIDRSFIELAMNEVVLAVLGRMITGKFILNQQNGVINPPGQEYNQAAWHRDLPYQHFVSSRPIAINALYCVDAFTRQNGATYVLPASHKEESFPSGDFTLANQVQVEAPAGSFILIDAMTFHKGGFNASSDRRRAVSHLYTIPYIKQQVDIPAVLQGERFEPAVADLLGFRYRVADSVDDFLNARG